MKSVNSTFCKSTESLSVTLITFQTNANHLLIGIERTCKADELNNEKLDVKIEKLKDESIASMITLSEQNRRMMEMMKMYGMASMGMDAESTLVLNANHPLVKYVVENKENENVSLICKQLYDLAMLAHKPLSPEEMTAFVLRSNEIMMMLTK